MPARSDHEWQAWGRVAPYFGVLTEAAYRARIPDDDARRAFFATGEATVADTLARLERIFGTLPLDRALDYGCGVGRLLLPLARRSRAVVGADVAPAMLAEAERNLARAELGNATLREANDLLGDDADPGFDLIVSMITLQHLEPAHALDVTRRLLRLLRPGGVAALHYTIKDQRRMPRRSFTLLRRRLRLIHRLANLREGKPWSWPYMGVYVHDPLALGSLIRAAGCSEPELALTDEGGIVGAVFHFRRL
jgi:SAM-dependent methyltransferase